MLETNILHFQTFLFDLSPLALQGQGHFVNGNRQMEDANVGRDIGHLKDFFSKRRVMSYSQVLLFSQ